MTGEYRPCTQCGKADVHAIPYHETGERRIVCASCGHEYGTLPAANRLTLATVGLEALIDEAAGFQQHRGKDDLKDRLTALAKGEES